MVPWCFTAPFWQTPQKWYLTLQVMSGLIKIVFTQVWWGKKAPHVNKGFAFCPLGLPFIFDFPEARQQWGTCT